MKAFEATYGAKFPKAVAKITDDVDQLLAFYDFPAEHWVHLRTTNPIESTFATVRNRSKITKGPGSRAAGIAMAYKLIEAAQSRWRAVNAPHLVALVRAGALSRTANSSNAPIGMPRERHRAAACHACRQRVLLPTSQGRHGRLRHRDLGVGRASPAELSHP